MADVYDSGIARFIGTVTRIPGVFGVTISKDCTLYSTTKNLVNLYPELIAEEEAHKQQYAELGGFKLITTYLWKNLTKGYDKNYLEVQAKQIAKTKE